MQSKRADIAIIGIVAILLMVFATYTFDLSFKPTYYIFIFLCLSIIANIFLYYKFYALILLFFLIPYSFSTYLPGTGMALSVPAELLCLLLFIWLIIHWARYGINKVVLSHPISVLLIADLLWMILTIFYSEDPEVSMKRVIMRIVFVGVGYFLLFQWYKSKKNLLKPFLYYGIGLVPVVLLILNHHAIYSFDPKVSFNISEPYYSDHTIYGACIAFILPIFYVLIRKKTAIIQIKSTRVIFWIAGFILFIGFILAYSRAAWLSILFAIGFGLLLKWKVKPIIFAGLLVIVVSVGIFLKEPIYNHFKETETVSNDGDVKNHFTSVTNISTDASNLERINRWVCAYRMFKEKPIVGFGPGTYQFYYANYQTIDFKTYISTNHGNRGNAHSEYLTYLSETGLPGFLIFILWLGYAVFIGIKNNLKKEGVVRWINNAILLALITFVFHGFFNSFIDQDKMALLVFPALAALAAIDSYSYEEVE